MFRLIFILIFTAVSGAKHLGWRTDPKHCEVCLHVVHGIKLAIRKVHSRRIHEIEGYLHNHCSISNERLKDVEREFCRHLVGGARAISTPLAQNKGTKEICTMLDRIAPEVCDIKYVQIEL